MPKIKKIIIFTLLVICLMSVFFYGNHKKEPATTTDSLSYEYQEKASTSVYDFMTKLQTEGKIIFKEKNYPGMGKFIEEINGQKNDVKNWIYYVNDKKANIGISNYQLNPGDVVSWKYENSY